MMRRPLTLLLLLGLSACVLIGAGAAETRADRPFLSALFSDNMVLQRDRKVPVWGWTQPGAKVTVQMEGKSATATADADGKWLAKLGPFAAGGPYKLTITGPQNVTLDNVLVGDVWICSGQSNMEMGIGNVNNAQQEIANANYPQIRLFTVPKVVAMDPRSETSGQWSVCSPTTVAAGGWNGFTAVGYFFGRELQKQLKIPIGLIHTSWGGTPAEAWTSAEALKTMPDYRPAVETMEKSLAARKQGDYDFDKQMTAWWAKNDPGSANGLGWADPAFDTSGWKTMTLPTAWEQAGLPDFDGVVWFRKEIEIPMEAAGKEAVLHLGPIDDRDTTWVNGVPVGSTNMYNAPRDYKIPANVLKAGKNLIAVRVLDTGGAGGLYGEAAQMKLEIAGEMPLPLAGDWLYKDSAPLAKMEPAPVRLDENPFQPMVLYNGMISPLLPYGIKGAIWYQGESNAGKAYQYRTLLPTMIQDWRTRWGEGAFPFYIVQLANFTKTKPEPGEDAWAELREAQLMTAERIPHAGIAVTIDIGDADDIHPKDKQDVGKRLALAALATTYGQKIEYSGPRYKSMKVEGSTIRLTFDHIGGGLMAKEGDKLQGFAIAGGDKHFVWADAVIKGDTILVSAPQVPHPAAVRYAWAANPVCNLVNKAGLPASPFRTDDWPGVTVNAK